MYLFLGENILAQSVEKGISKELALYRAKSISSLNYKLSFSIPEKLSESIPAQLQVRFILKDISLPLVFDFSPGSKNLQNLTGFNGKAVPYTIQNGHIIIQTNYLRKGENKFTFAFIAGEQSLNRNPDFLYTLLVPARANTFFPCFDQPDLKASWELILEIPQNWSATANGELSGIKTISNRAIYTFLPTKPISTYLFAFTAGKFQKVSRTLHGVTYNLYHRETDTSKLRRNLDPVFKQVFQSVEWLESYTQIKQPFVKYDFVAIPFFQYGGMEHPGNIYFGADRLFLDETATQTDELNRATLIAHETAHLWFGDLVTMKWFNDVWLKEVFANFMADKMVNPMYPEINHNLRFLLDHHPKAYAVDRTAGANPIQQTLDNLANAGSLYGNIIYHKSPVVMNQLELIVGMENLQEGLQKYLKKYSYSNAQWDDLIPILDAYTPVDLEMWSSVWVKDAGMPTVSAFVSGNKLCINQKGMPDFSKSWPQRLTILTGVNGKLRTDTVFLEKNELSLPMPNQDYQFILPSADHNGYGNFSTDSKSAEWLLENINSISNPLYRGTSWITLNGMMIQKAILPYKIITSVLNSVAEEREELIISYQLNLLQSIFWRWLTLEERLLINNKLESLLWQKMEESTTKSLKAACFKAYLNIANSPAAQQRLYEIWKDSLQIKGLKFSENDKIRIVCELALRNFPASEAMLTMQMDSIKNVDNKVRMKYIIPSLSKYQSVRNTFFESLKNPAMRANESWTTEALGYLNHPLREKDAISYILPGLNLLEEIKATGDIFFPASWLGSLLNGHRSMEAAVIVRSFLDNNKSYPKDLNLKILQSADILFRINP